VDILTVAIVFKLTAVYAVLRSVGDVVVFTSLPQKLCVTLCTLWFIF